MIHALGFTAAEHPHIRHDIQPLGVRATSGSAHQNRSSTMHTDHSLHTLQTMHEALARDHARERQQQARHAALVRDLSAQRRWHRVSSFARAAEKRHAQRVRQSR